MRRVLVLSIVFAMALAACGKDQKVGSEKLLQFKEQQRQGRLGESTPTPAAPAGVLGIGAATPKPMTPAPTPQTAPERFFDVTLVADSPYYQPGNELVMSSQLTLRVTNKDNTAERPTRRFYSEGVFDSGPLRFGQSWTFKFPGAASGKIQVNDAYPFIFATLTVQ